MLRPDGYVKVLDFGLAKLTEGRRPAGVPDATTQPDSLTNPGTVMGTVTYMSPEQARGLSRGRAHRHFQPGRRFYEMITGHVPFAGQTASDVIASILDSEPPPPSAYSPRVPAGLDRIVIKALAKDKGRRYQTAEDLVQDLRGLSRDLEFQSRLARSGRPAAGGAHEDAPGGGQVTSKSGAGGGAGREELTAATPRAVCLSCRAHNPGLAKFCLSCGASLASRCSGCEAEVPPGARFCMSCGQQAGGITPADHARHARLAAATPASLASKIRAGAKPTGERRVVTALVIDLGGSAPSGKQVEPEDWAAILNRALDRLSHPIFRYEGTIARLLGNSLLAFFGAPVAHEDDPARAVRAALDLLAAAREYAAEVRREHGVEFEARVGLNTGLVLVGAVGADLRYEYTVLGDTVNLAARIQSAARPMAALLTHHTHRFIAPLFDCVELDAVEVKGQIEPVRIYEARGAKSGPGRVRGLTGLESPMVGRDGELTALMRLSEAARAGLGRVAVVMGEPGIGKTRLITEWRAAAVEAGEAGGPPLQWAEGHCLSYGQGHAYHLLLDLLRSLLGIPASADESDARTALLIRAGDLFGDSALDVYPYLGHLLSLRLEGAALERVRQLDPQALQYHYFMTWRRLLQALSARRPLALVLEDIHWADPSSTELLVRLLPLASESPLLFCIVTRPDREAPGWRLVEAAREAAGARLAELALSELSEADSRRLVAHLLDVGSLPEEVRESILEKAEGNPFFVEEVIRMLIDRGAIARSGERWVAGSEISAAESPTICKACCSPASTDYLRTSSTRCGWPR